MRARQLGGQNQIPVARRDRGPQPGLQPLFGRDLAHLGILGEQGWLRPPADPARRACAPAKRLIRKMGGSRSAPLLTLLYALTFARWRRQPVPAARRLRGASSDRGRSRLLSRGDRTFESISLQQRDGMGQAARKWHHRRCSQLMECPDAPAERPRPSLGQALSRSLVALDQDSPIIAVVEMSQSSWLVAGMLPGIERQPRKKLEPSAERLLGLLHRWRDEAVKAGRKITRIALAFEAGRDGFWLARWLRARGVEAHVIHPSSVA